MRYLITHRTRYDYSEAVTLCHNETRLRPREHPRQTCAESTLTVTPQPQTSRDWLDYYGNRVHYFAVQEPHRRLEVVSSTDIVLRPPTEVNLSVSPSWNRVADSLNPPTTAEQVALREYCLASPYVPLHRQFVDFAQRAFPPNRPLLEGAHALMEQIYTEFEYDPTFTTLATPIRTVMRHQRGVCQDFAHLFLAAMRSLGLPARYVSGYLETLPPPGQTKLQGADASHAWVSVHCPHHGWVDFDPTNNHRPSMHHVTVAWGRDYGDVIPMNGVIYGGGKTKLSVSVDVRRYLEDNEVVR
ncbi:MAG: transglutaminase family protein [Pseudomonadota bacterium]|nr:transglutaminase family protein [Pseudomonadota bacterium]